MILSTVQMKKRIGMRLRILLAKDSVLLLIQMQQVEVLLLIRSFLSFSHCQFLTFTLLIKLAQNFKFPGFSDWLFRFLQTAIDWLSCIHFYIKL